MRVKVINKRPASVLQKKRVCAYARVSTDSRRQEDSLENQMETYERMITGNPEYEFIGVFADQGISGYCENRPQFQRMMEKARAGEIDLIITKSISRFARNTVTVLKFARELKELGVGIFFEEQNINTLSGDGEMMLAVLASFAQEESRSMSENNKWSIRKKFERGEVMITTSRFLGYDKNEYGDLIVNRKEAEIVSLTFDLYLLNVGSSRIGELLDYLGVKTVTGTTWESGTINGMLCNEKYKGDFHLQKYYTPENKRNHTRKNNGEVQSYYISENHEPIVSLIKDSKEQPISIGIHGDWGAGKSSILEMVENEVKLASSVSGKKYSCIRFNGWKHQGFEDSKVALMSSIISELEKKEKLGVKSGEILKKLWKNINWMTVAKTAGKTALGIATGTAPLTLLSSTMDILKSTVTTEEGIAGAIESIGGYLSDAKITEDISSNKEFSEFQENFAELLEDAAIEKLIVLIDDLDRCLPDVAINTLEAVRLFMFTEKTALVYRFYATIRKSD